MKFVCGTCSAKYTIADERVAGKVLKIRCKSCGAIIEVSGAPVTKQPQKSREARRAPRRSGSDLAERFAESFKTGSGGKPAETPGLFQAVKRSAGRIEKDETEVANWFVAIDDNPVGPIAAGAVLRHQKSGKVTDDSLVWKEGMPDWTPLRHCKELVGLLAKLSIVESLGDEGVGEERSPAPLPRRGGLLADAGEAGAEAPSPLRGQRFGRVDDIPEALPRPPAALSPAVLDDVLADDLAPHAPPKPAAAEEAFFGDFPEADGVEGGLSSLQQISLPRITSQNRWIALAAVGFLGMAIAVLVVALFTGGSPETRVITEVVERIIEVEKEKVVYRDKPQVEVEKSAPAQDEPDRRVATARPRSAQPGTGGKAEPESDDERKRRLLEQMGLGVPSGDQKLVGGADRSTAASKGSGSSNLTEDQIRRTLANNRRTIQACYERSLKQGEVPEDRGIRADTSILVGGSGMVRTVKVTGTAAQYPNLRACIENAVKKWVFPASSGDSPVEIPTLFTPR